MKTIQWIKDRASEPSTRRAAIWFVGGVFGLFLVWRTPMFATNIAGAVQIILGCMTAAGALGMAQKDPAPPTPPAPEP